jgi:hypothetical protein
MKWLALVVVMTACTSPDLSMLQPHLEVHEIGSRLYAGAYFDSKPPDVSIDATFRGTTVTLQRVSDDVYTAPFDIDHSVEGDEPVTFRFEGTTMTVTAPPPLDITAPLFVSRSLDTPLTWTTPSPDPLQGLVSLSQCVRGGDDVPPNATSVTLNATNLMLPDGSQSPGTCTTMLDFERVREGTLDPAFAGGSLEFRRTFYVSFASTP